jgi:hypothetical protein
MGAVKYEGTKDGADFFCFQSIAPRATTTFSFLAQ